MDKSNITKIQKFSKSIRRNIIDMAFSEIGEQIEWKGVGIKEVGFGVKRGKVLIF